MRLVKRLWKDETGLVMSAEAVMIGTIGVVGAVVGMSTASTAVDQELKEFASAIRSLDQSYGFYGQQSCRAWTSGSYYRQPSVQQALTDLCANGTADIVAIQTAVDAQRATPFPAVVEPIPNKIDVPKPDPASKK